MALVCGTCPLPLVEGQGETFILLAPMGIRGRHPLRSTLTHMRLTTANGIHAQGDARASWHWGSRPVSVSGLVVCNSINMYYSVQALG